MDIRKISWQDTIPLRHSVLWPNRSPEFCKLDDDADGLHFGAYVNDLLVCVASVYTDNNNARLRKFATDERFQNQGVGSTMLQHIIEYLENAKVASFWCDARESALGFYERFGMVKNGERFYKSEVPYFKMEVPLQ